MTYDLDLTAPNPYLTPGVHLWRVDKAERKVSKSGNDQIVVNFSRVDNSMQKMTDYLALSAGAFDGTKRKLQALLGEDYRGSFDNATAMMVGRYVFASTEINEFQGRSSLRPSQGALTHNGYHPYVEGGPAPAGYVPPADTPF